jgi:hypothetical protein
VTISVIGGAAWDVTGTPAAAFAVLAFGVLALVFITPTIDFGRRA